MWNKRKEGRNVYFIRLRMRDICYWRKRERERKGKKSYEMQRIKKKRKVTFLEAKPCVSLSRGHMSAPPARRGSSLLLVRSTCHLQRATGLFHHGAAVVWPMPGRLADKSRPTLEVSGLSLQQLCRQNTIPFIFTRAEPEWTIWILWSLRGDFCFVLFCKVPGSCTDVGGIPPARDAPLT